MFELSKFKLFVLCAVQNNIRNSQHDANYSRNCREAEHQQ